MAVYACSDFHGCIDFYKAIKNFIKPEDKVYFLGDAGDRGPEPWETIKAVARDPQFVYIKGNHEDMLVKAAYDYFDNDYMGGYRLLANNGGADTFDQMMLEESAKGWANHLKNLPTFETYINENNETVLLSHAGFSPWLNVHTNKLAIPNEHRLIWDRDHLYENYDEEGWDPNAIIVHGHTPIPYLWDSFRVPEEYQEKGAFWYADGRKLCIYSGAVWTGHAVLVNLDTWDEEIFEI